MMHVKKNTLKVAGAAISCLVMALLLMAGCSPERKLAQQFIKDKPPFAIQLFTPAFVYKFNHKGEDIEGFDSLSPEGQDSSLWATSRFMQFVSDSAFLERYINGFITELRELGFTVYTEEAVGSFLQTQPQAYIVSIPQLQLDEYYSPWQDSTYYGDSLYTIDIRLNAVDFSSWLELSKINSARPVTTVLYNSQTATDGFRGSFILNGVTLEVEYRQKTDSLLLEDIYDLAGYSGKKHAGYLFDYFMNQYIVYHLPEGLEPLGYFHYNRYKRSLYFTEDDRFQVLESK